MADLLRPALEAAVEVARTGEHATPRLPAPSALRPLLRLPTASRRLPLRALDPVRRALDDDEFRLRVRGAVNEDEVGRAGWLLLDRPEGWAEELAELEASSSVAAEVAAEEREERSARKRLAGAEEAVRRSEATAAAAAREVAELRAALAEERRARRAADTEAGRLRRALRDTEGSGDAASTQAAAEEARRVSEAAAAAAAELAAVVAERDALIAERDVLAAAVPPAAVFPAVEPVVGEPAVVDRVALCAAVAAASDGVARLADALALVAKALGAPTDPGDDAVPEAASGPAVRASSRERQGKVTRRAARLPPAVFDDSVEAAEHLLRLPHAVLVVDGYNLSKEAWPELPIATQRDRLITSLTELAARTCCEVRIVFDGVEGRSRQPVVAGGRGQVGVTFTPAGVEADDVVIGLVAELPARRPVIVASSDRRVQDGAMRNGANVLTAGQLLGVLR